MREVDAANQRRLDSWKQIAAFFGRDERTVRRWEKERALPVHHIPGKARGSVYAFEHELAQWLTNPNHAEDDSSKPPSPSEVVQTVVAPPPPEAAQTVLASPRPAPPEAAPTVLEPPLPPSRRVTKSLIVALVLLVGVGILALRLIHPSVPAVARTAGSPVPAAVDLYLKGRYAWSKRSPASLNQAVDYFTQAIALDSRYAQAYAGLADTYNLLREYTPMPDAEAYPKAIAAARKAVELDDSLNEAHRALAFASFYWSWDFVGAEREFKRAIELNPNDAVAHHWYATALASLGRFDQAVSELDRARELDPTSNSITADRALILFEAGQGREAVSLLRQIAAAAPGFISPHRYLSVIALSRHDYPTFLAESKKMAELMNDQVRQQIFADAEQAFAAGGAPAMITALRNAEQQDFGKGLISGYELAQVLAWSGQNKEALDYLQHEFEAHNPWLVGLEQDVWLKGLHQDPAFRTLASQIGLPELANR